MKIQSKELFERTKQEISVHNIYKLQEVQNIVFLLLEHCFELHKTAVLANRELQVSEQAFQKFARSVQRIIEQEPLQYILGHTFFYGEELLVNKNVLIPRPETEELVSLILQDYQHNTKNLKILDIATGSGCIAITLAKKLANANVFASDISENALKIARQNAQNLKTNVEFIRNDILKESLNLSNLDIVLSNPPYVLKNEQSLMRKNVLDYEPHIALFVEDKHPLVFYEKITVFAKENLNRTGKLYFEINEKYGKEVSHILANNHFEHILIHQDIFGKERIVSASKA